MPDPPPKPTTRPVLKIMRIPEGVRTKATASAGELTRTSCPLTKPTTMISRLLSPLLSSTWIENGCPADGIDSSALMVVVEASEVVIVIVIVVMGVVVVGEGGSVPSLVVVVVDSNVLSVVEVVIYSEVVLNSSALVVAYSADVVVAP